VLLHSTTDVTNQIILVDSGVKQWATIYDPFGNPYRKVWGYYVTAGGGSEAKKFFLGDSNDERDVVKVLELRIERLQQANKTSGGWRDIIDKLWH
jgi:hypothetical protein